MPVTEHTSSLPTVTAVGREVIRFDRVTVHYGSTPALVDFSLSVGAGRTTTLLGPSGSGKSTALKILAGFERPSSGRVHLNGRDVTDVPPHRRGLGVVVQNYALFPHMRVADNVAFGLRARRMPRADIAGRVQRTLELVGMAELARRYPRELSGGQQQRVAIARALAIEPAVLLLDEPLSALDARLRQDMLGELQRMRAALPDTAILYVTHDQVEALSLADEIAVMRDGRIVDCGTADRLYRRPPSAFTAQFLGDANLLPVEVLAGDAVLLDGELIRPAASTDARGPALLCVRPHELLLRRSGGIPGVVRAAQWRGAAHRLTVELRDGTTVAVDVPAAGPQPAPGSAVHLGLGEGIGVVLPPDAAASAPTGIGE